jgi:hypothetical protein
MFGYSGDDLTNFWGLIGFGTALGAIGFTLSHRWYRRAFFASAILFSASGLFWGETKRALPAVAPVLSRLTSNPSNWFLILVLLIAALWLHQYQRELMVAVAKAAAPPKLSPDAGQEKELKYFHTRFEQLDNVVLKSIWERINELRQSVQEVEKKTTFPPNLGDNFTEAVQAIEGALQSQLARVRDQISGYSAKINEANLDLIHLLDFTVNQATIAFLDNLIEQGPKIPPESLSQIEPENWASTLEETEKYLNTVQTSIAGTMRGGMFNQMLFDAAAHVENSLSGKARYKWPQDIDPIFLRKYLIARYQRMRTQAFLHGEKREVEERVRVARNNLLSRLSGRQKT